MKRLSVGAAMTAAVWIALQFHDSTPDDPIDIAMVAEIGFTMTFAAAVMLIFTRTWSGRAVGVALTTTGTALAYIGVTWGRLNATALPPGTTVTTVLPTGETIARTYPRGMVVSQPNPEWYVDLLRSFYIVGGPLFFVGLCIWVWAWVAQHKSRTPDPTMEGTERRSGIDRRRGWGKVE